MATASARDELQSTLKGQKDNAASGLGDFAAALRRAARESSGGADGGTRRMVEWTAGGLERVSATLRSKDLNGMVHEVESFARQQPVAFFFAAAAAGFLATRFLKAGAGENSGATDYSSMTRL